MLKHVITELQEQITESDDIFVKGFGKLSGDMARKTSIQRLESAVAALKKGSEFDFKNAHNIIYGSGVLEEIFNAVIAADEANNK